MLSCVPATLNPLKPMILIFRLILQFFIIAFTICAMFQVLDGRQPQVAWGILLSYIILEGMYWLRGGAKSYKTLRYHEKFFVRGQHTELGRTFLLLADTQGRPYYVYIDQVDAQVPENLRFFYRKETGTPCSELHFSHNPA